jgi:hypothetical protein
VHRLTRRQFHSQTIYFYKARSRKGPRTLVGSDRLHIQELNSTYGDTTLAARSRYEDPKAGITSACSRHRLVSDMGPPFFLKECGRKHIP